jgi:hypothetical protein
MAADGHTKRRILVRSMRYGLRVQPALLVRGSSRRIMTLRFRPAYIRVINRRYLSTAATCSAFQTKTAALSPDGEARPGKQNQKPSNPEIILGLTESIHIRTTGEERTRCGARRPRCLRRRSHHPRRHLHRPQDLRRLRLRRHRPPDWSTRRRTVMSGCRWAERD